MLQLLAMMNSFFVEKTGNVETIRHVEGLLIMKMTSKLKSALTDPSVAHSKQQLMALNSNTNVIPTKKKDLNQD